MNIPRKLQQFYIVKTTTRRLRKAGYKIEYEDTNHARRCGEIVAIGESQLIRSLFDVMGDSDDLQGRLNRLAELTTSKRKRASNARVIDELLFIPQLVSVVVDKKSEYRHIIKNGFEINGRKYVRLLCGAGHSRRNNVFFIQDIWEQPLKKVLNNDRDESIQIAPSKFNAYFALCSSATYPVSEARFGLVPDAEIVRKTRVEMVEEVEDKDNPYLDDLVYEIEQDIEFNLFDGQGLIGLDKARVWADDLGLDYVPSAFIIRNSFMKGLVVVFDFHQFAQEKGLRYFTDSWGNVVDVWDIDLILTESQLKMWKAYGSNEDYVSKCRKNNLGWGVTRYSPYQDHSQVSSNYQFLQVEDFDEDDLMGLCKPTIDFFGEAIGDDPSVTQLYLMGKLANQPFESASSLMDSITDPVTRALLLAPEMLNDPYVKNHVIYSLNKKIRDSYIGTLLLDGNYQLAVSDPYALCEHVFGLEVKGLLADKEHYSWYWVDKGVDKVVAMRAPLTWRSEVNILNMVRNNQIDYWYQYIDGAIIYNVHGLDCMLQADSDYDGDIVMTTDNPYLIKNAYGGLPITYSKNPTPKKEIVEDELFEYDLNSFDTRIGFITNCSTTLYAMLADEQYNQDEKDEIIKRLKICRKEQGNQIDKAKGLNVKAFPKHWTQWTAIKDDNQHLEEIIEKNNRLLIDKRPYFMRYLYSNYNKQFTKHNENFDKYCLATFGKPFSELTGEHEDEQEIIEKYDRYSPLLDTNCTMNRICRLMERSVKEIKLKFPNKIDKDAVKLMKDHSIPFDSNKFKQVEKLFRKYRTERAKFNKISFASSGAIGGIELKYRTIEQYNKGIRAEALGISQDLGELTNYAVAICYELYPSDTKNFVWSVFGEQIVENIKNNLVLMDRPYFYVPILTEDRSDDEAMTFMGRKYRKILAYIEENDEYINDNEWVWGGE